MNENGDAKQTTNPTSDQHSVIESGGNGVVATKKPKMIFIIIAIAELLVILISAVFVYFAFLKKDSAPLEVEQVNNIVAEPEIFGTPEPVVSDLNSLTYITPKFLDLSITWQEPTKISPLGYINNELQAPNESEAYDADHVLVNYYEAGSFTGGKIIYVDYPYDGPGSHLDVFIAREGQKTELLNRYGNPFSSENQSDYYTGRYNDQMVVVNTDTILTDTWAPDTIVIKGQKMALPKYTYNESSTYSNNSGFYSPGYSTYDDANKTLVSTTNEGNIYEVTKTKDGYSLVLFELEMANKFRVSYILDGEITGAEIQPITWTDGTKNTSSYETFGYGCGGGNYALVVDTSIGDLVQIGTSDKGQKIYGFKDMENKVAKQLLSEVNARAGEYIYPDNNNPFTAEEFQTSKAVILFEDAMGRVIAYKNNANFIEGGCAKPVIYLYPEVATSIDVRVGADVTISDPQYEQLGWQNVIAYPNGTLKYRGSTYNSLFWEGAGHGEYPDIRNKGVVVPRENVVPTLRDHLSRQGFNQAETNDFIDFWSVNLPDKPYVRIAWLNTAQMNQLAPLYLSVKPDTIIRTFVELEGLDVPRELTPQQFTAPIRKGFTVTEWGGLAINGLDQLNYPTPAHLYQISLPIKL